MIESTLNIVNVELQTNIVSLNESTYIWLGLNGESKAPRLVKLNDASYFDVVSCAAIGDVNQYDCNVDIIFYDVRSQAEHKVNLKRFACVADDHETQSSVEALLNDKVSASLSSALQNVFNSAIVQNSTPMLRAQQQNSSEPGFIAKNIKMAAAILIAPLILTAVYFASPTKPVGSVEVAATNYLHSNPDALKEQVELTRETLKQMGLDPGASGDVGCLAPQ